MPLESRTSRSFKDISLSFVKNPATDDVTTLVNERAITRSIRNLVTTLRGERFFEPDLGCDVNNLLFENFLDENSIDVLQSEITQTILQYEPRVKLDPGAVQVTPDVEGSSISIRILFRIVGLDADQQVLEFVFQPLR
jgi:phage baseplate assembly protein W|tara:strand:+ start:8273 stop:8686 length:414 start_codon:yes stop_codon:yes gene_type:complete